DKLSAEPGNWRGGLQNRLGRKCSETTNDLRANGGKLLPEKWIAGTNLVWFRIAVIRRAALQNIANVNVFALKVDRLDDLREQLAGAHDEGQALLIFVVSGSFTNEDELGFGISGTENDVCASSCKFASLAVTDLRADGVEGHRGTEILIRNSFS